MTVENIPIRLDLERPETWPASLVAYLERQLPVFRAWEEEAPERSAYAYDRAVCGLADELKPFSILGWHCTRLTDAEITAIVAEGMHLPNAEMLFRRIDAVVAAGLMNPDIAHALRARNQAADSNRADMVCFCFYPPKQAGEWGIERFFRHWGGEALYNSHENDTTTSPVLASIGIPSLIETDVPIVSLSPHGGVEMIVYRRFLVSRGHVVRGHVDHEDRAKVPLPASGIRRIIRYPDPEFMRLTGCAGWQRPIEAAGGSRILK